MYDHVTYLICPNPFTSCLYHNGRISYTMLNFVYSHMNLKNVACQLDATLIMWAWLCWYYAVELLPNYSKVVVVIGTQKGWIRIMPLYGSYDVIFMHVNINNTYAQRFCSYSCALYTDVQTWVISESHKTFRERQYPRSAEIKKH